MKVVHTDVDVSVFFICIMFGSYEAFMPILEFNVFR